MEANLGLNGRQGRSRFYGGGVGGLPPSAFEQLEECLFPKVISVSPCLVFHFSVRYRKYEATHGFLLVVTVIRNILPSGSLLDFTTASIHLVQYSGFIITRKKGNDAFFGSIQFLFRATFHHLGPTIILLDVKSNHFMK